MCRSLIGFPTGIGKTTTTKPCEKNGKMTRCSTVDSHLEGKVTTFCNKSKLLKTIEDMHGSVHIVGEDNSDGG